MEKIAIIGFSCLFPDAQNPEMFWQNLMASKDSATVATPAEFGVDPTLFYSPVKGNPDKTYSLKGGYIRRFEFDPTGYHLPPEHLQALDAIAQSSVYVARQALQHSGYWQAAPRSLNCGVLLGNLSMPTRSSNRLFASLYQQVVEPAVRQLIHYPHLRLPSPSTAGVALENARVSSLPATTVAQALSLTGACYALDAACSSSLYAIKLAGHYLLSHQADLMLAGAVSYADALFVRILFSGVQAYPDNGISCPLDPRSRGLTPADGAGMVVLKRYSEAVRDGDAIYGIIAGVGLSNDGRGKHLLSPNQKGQILAFERAYEEAHLSPQAIDYLECHATGTLVGDSTELGSIESFFGQHQAFPRLGATKANVGHLLTAAGMVSLIKVLLGMNQGVIPPTIHVQEPVDSSESREGSDRIVTRSTRWPQTGQPRRAAINSFGFGGTNAHLIVQQPDPSAAPSQNAPAEPVPLVPLAITGMAAHFGGCDSLDAFDRSLYDGVQQFRPLPLQRWRGLEADSVRLQAAGLETGEAPQGAYIDAFEIDPLRFKIPPSDVHKLQPQQLLMAKVADQALQDAQIEVGGKVAVIIAMETDLSIHQMQQRWNVAWQVESGLAASGASLPPDALAALTKSLKDSLHPPAQTTEHVGYLGNIMASRIAALWDFNGPAFTLSAGDQSAIKALEAAQILLSHGEVGAVLVGAVDLAGGFESVLWHHALSPLSTGTPTLSHDQNAQGWMVGEGAGAVVLKRVDAAQQSRDRRYALIEAVCSGQEPVATAAAPTAAMVAQVCQQAHETAHVQPTDIGYLELVGGGTLPTDEAEIRGLAQVYGQSAEQPQRSRHCAVGSVSANIGHTHTASGLASLIKTALCLYHRYLPVVPQWSAPKQLDLWRQTPFYVAQESRGWLQGKGAGKRRAAISQVGGDRTCAHLVLSEDPAQSVRPSPYLVQTPFYLLPLAGSDHAALQTKLTALKQALAVADSLAALAWKTFRQFQQEPSLPYTVALVGSTQQTLMKELDRAFEGVATAFETGEAWQTPGGSYFTATPQAAQGQVAFVYPGAFSAYMGQTRDYFRLFPQLHDHPIFQSTQDRIARLDRLFYPRSLKALSRRQREVLEQKLLSDPIAMFEADVACAGFTTTILQELFQIKPQCAFGYSLGETSMMLAQGVFANAEFGQGSHALNQSPLFSDRISGPKNAVREYWGLPPAITEEDFPLWNNHVLLAKPADVKAAIQGRDRVYLTQINTPNEVIIGGAPVSCKAVIETLGCSAFEAPFDHVIHCPAMASEYKEVLKLNGLSIHRQPDIRFYSAVTGQPMQLERQTVGHLISQNLCQAVDFPHLVNRVYEDGARVFVEVGAGGTCSRWISEILTSKPHLTTLLNRRGMDDHTSVVRALARMVSHGVALDLTPLYGAATPDRRPRISMMKTIPLGGTPITQTLVSPQNQARFQGVQVQVRPMPNSPASRQAQTECTPIAAGNPPPPVNPIPPHPAMTSPPTPRHPEPTERSRSAVSATSPDRMLDPDNPQLQQLQQTNAAMTQAHAQFLTTRKVALKQFQHLIDMQLTVAETTLGQNSNPFQPSEPNQK